MNAPLGRKGASVCLEEFIFFDLFILFVERKQNRLLHVLFCAGWPSVQNFDGENMQVAEKISQDLILTLAITNPERPLFKKL